MTEIPVTEPIITAESEDNIEPRVQDRGLVMALGANVVLNLPQLADKLVHLAQQPEPEKIPSWAICVGGVVLVTSTIWLINAFRNATGYGSLVRHGIKQVELNSTCLPALSNRVKRQEASRLKVGMRDKTAPVTKKGFSLGGAAAFVASFRLDESQHARIAVEKNLLILGKNVDAQIDALVVAGDFEGARKVAENATRAVGEIKFQMDNHPSFNWWKNRLG